MMSAKRKALAVRIFAQHRKLQRTLDHQAGAIYDTWTALSLHQRRETLTKIRPNMPKYHRPDAEAFLRGDKTQIEAYMAPLINLEDLIVDDTILIMLNARGRSQPHEFAHADAELTAFWIQIQDTSDDYPGYAIELYGITTARSYGRLVPLGKKYHVDHVYLQRGIFRPSDGLRVMETQALILDFLVDFMKAIATPDSGPSSGKETKSGPSPTSQRVYNSLGDFSTMTLYETPSHEHIARLNEIVKCERDSKEDQIWSLREDPGAFAESMLDEVNHLWEANQDQHDQCVLRPMEQHGKTIWATAAQQLIKNMYMDFAFFDELLKLGQEFEAQVREYDPVNWQEDLIPQNVAESYVRLFYTLDFLESKMTQQIRMGLTVSPPLRDSIMTVINMAQDLEDPSSDMRAEIVRKDPAVVKLMDLLSVFFDHKKLEEIPMHIFTDALNRLVKEHPDVNDLLSSWNTLRISNLSIIAEYRHQLDRLHPWTYKAAVEALDMKEVIEADFLNKFGSRWDMTDCSHDQTPSLNEFANPKDDRFDYPAHKQPSREVVEACRTAEANLDKFWVKFDVRVRNDDGESYRDLVDSILEQDHEIQRTPVWVEPIPLQRRITTLRITNVPPSTITKKEEISPGKQPVAQNAQNTQPMQGTKRPKTANTQLPIHPKLSRSQEWKGPVLSVDRRSKDVLEAIFHKPSSRDRQHPGEIRWKEFLHAMCQVGFSGCQLKGSIWNLARQVDDEFGQAKINVHEPHPLDKCSFSWMRFVGRRFTRRLGWTGEMVKASR